MNFDTGAPPAAHAARTLSGLARRYLRAGQAAAKPHCSAADRHRFRLLSKRFRYSLEIFREFYCEGIDERIATLRRIQTALGEANDCEATLRLPPVSEAPEFAEWLRRRQKRFEHEFRRIWHDEFDARGSGYWTGYLSQPRDTAK